MSLSAILIYDICNRLKLDSFFVLCFCEYWMMWMKIKTPNKIVWRRECRLQPDSCLSRLLGECVVTLLPSITECYVRVSMIQWCVCYIWTSTSGLQEPNSWIISKIAFNNTYHDFLECSPLEMSLQIYSIPTFLRKKMSTFAVVHSCSNHLTFVLGKVSYFTLMNFNSFVIDF